MIQRGLTYTHPVHTEQIFVRAYDLFCVLAAVDQILRGRGRDIALPPQDVVQVLAFGIAQQRLHLERNQKAEQGKDRTALPV